MSESDPTRQTPPDEPTMQSTATASADAPGAAAPASERPARPSNKAKPVASITDDTLKKAIRDAAAGLTYDRRDPACPGLTLRVRGRKVSWTVRTRLDGEQKRYFIGDASIDPKTARRRATQVKQWCEDGNRPDKLIKEFLTGVSVFQQVHIEVYSGPASITWEAARTMYLAEVERTLRPDTLKDYRNILENTPELAVLEGVMVAGVTDVMAEQIYKKIHARVEPHSEHVCRVMSAMWTFLAIPGNRPVTGVKPYAIRAAKPPARTRAEDGDPHGKAAKAKKKDQPPPLPAIGRAVAIAKLGALGPRSSSIILTLAGSAQRCRPIAGLNANDLIDHGDEVEWKMPPFFRKTARKKRSRGTHDIPLLGWAAKAVRDLQRTTNGYWLIPVGATANGREPKNPHCDPGYVTKLMSYLPGVGFSPHQWRAAFATYGSMHLGWAKGDEKIILDHLEGYDSDDVTGQHYNTDPRMAKKRAMMTAWVAFLDKCAANAVAADPTLKDIEAVREAIYKKRYKEAGWKRAIERCTKRGLPLPWSGREEMALEEPTTVKSMEVWRKKRVPA